MPQFIWLSYIVNVMVLIPVCALTLTGNPRMEAVYGPDTTGRQILICMYLALIILSTFCLITHNVMPSVAWPIFSFQVIYKTISLILIKDRKVPVYWFNLAIAILHSVTLSLNPLA